MTYGYPADYTNVDFAAEARKELAKTVSDVVGSDPAVPVVMQVAEGHPAHVLTDAAESAALLVVGSRGHGAFAGMLLGSTSQHCIQHALTPVVVVRQPDAN